jgi:hypothetical protein
MADHRGDVSSKGLNTDLTSYVKRDAGPYLGRVKSTDDPLRMGRLGVNIISQTKRLNPTFSQLTWCNYLSPFYGAKSRDAVSTTNAYLPKSNGHSYGMWFVPPDIDTDVLVLFVEGEQNEENAFWIGCVQQPMMNHMIPGHGASTQAVAPPPPPSSKTTTDLYGTTFVPAGEINRYIWDKATPGKIGTGYYPVNDTSAEILKDQGLIKDPIRGTTTSSAQREAPSQVFGISTPGRIKSDSRTSPIELAQDDSYIQTPTDRDPGHSFVMDDGDVNNQNQLLRLRTASGHQLLMHDTSGVVYIANGSGKSWIEMTKDGKISVYSADGINMRTEGNFDLHSDGDINFHAKNHIKFTAENNVTLNSENYVQVIGENGILTSSQSGVVKTYGKAGISSYTGGGQMHGAGGRVDLAGSQVHFNSRGASSGWGPTWLKPTAAGVNIVTDESKNDVELNESVRIEADESGLLKANQRATKTTVADLVTHEPYVRTDSYPVDGVASWENEAEWERLSKTPGTLEYMAQKNRESKIKSIVDGQYRADIKNYITKKLGSSTAVTKANELAKEYNKIYNEIHHVAKILHDPIGSVEEILKKKVIAGQITNISNIVHGAVGKAIDTVITNIAQSSIGRAISRFFS